MHAYLIVGKNPEFIKLSINELSQNWGDRVFEFDVRTIEDVRNLKSITKLVSTEKTTIVIKNIHLVAPEAGNALLKTLEEPDKNTIFVLTAPSESSVLETINSRCQAIYTSENRILESSEVEDFINLELADKLEYLSKIKDRSEAINFLEQTIDQIRFKIYSGNANYSKLERDLSLAIETRERIKSFGNIQIQFANFGVHLN